MADEANPYEPPRSQPEEQSNPAQRKVIEGLFLGFFGLVAVGLMIFIASIFAYVLSLPITPPPPQRAYIVMLVIEVVLGFGAYQLFKGAHHCLMTFPGES